MMTPVAAKVEGNNRSQITIESRELIVGCKRYTGSSDDG
jgi:hypothetical protein